MECPTVVMYTFCITHGHVRNNITIVGAPLVGALPRRDTTVTVADPRAGEWIASRRYGYSIWNEMPTWGLTNTVGIFVAMHNQVQQMIEIAGGVLCGRPAISGAMVAATKTWATTWLPLQGMGVYDPEIHHRRSMRLKGYDYSRAGAYLVTVVAHGRMTHFGDVVKGRMQLNPAGEMVQRIWMEMPNRFPPIIMDEFIAMPNHVHGIIILAGAGIAGAPHLTIDRTSIQEKMQPQGLPLHRMGARNRGMW